MIAVTHRKIITAAMDGAIVPAIPGRVNVGVPGSIPMSDTSKEKTKKSHNEQTIPKL